MAVRDLTKGEAAKKDIVGSGNGINDTDNTNNNNDSSATNDTSSTGTQVVVWPLDLSSFESVKAFAAKANQELDRLDVLLENAAIGHSPYAATKDGWENSSVISYSFNL
jgi:NAD(P)-dependent dehydrogenase (short-subunit alcohol dehydrogenase family)